MKRKMVCVRVLLIVDYYYLYAVVPFTKAPIPDIQYYQNQ